MAVFQSTSSGRFAIERDGASGPWDDIADYPFCLGAWIYPLSSSDSSQCIMGFGNNNNTNDFHCIFYDTFGNDAFSALSREHGGSSIHASESAGNSPINAWYHVVALFHSSTSRELYVNGVSVASNTSSVTYTQADFDSCTIGCLPKLGAGTIDNIQARVVYPFIYNRALSSAEISEIMYKPNSIVDGLVWAPDLMRSETVATSIKDLSPKNYDITASFGTPNFLAGEGPPIYMPKTNIGA